MNGIDPVIRHLLLGQQPILTEEVDELVVFDEPAVQYTTEPRSVPAGTDPELILTDLVDQLSELVDDAIPSAGGGSDSPGGVVTPQPHPTT